MNANITFDLSLAFSLYACAHLESALPLCNTVIVLHNFIISLHPRSDLEPLIDTLPTSLPLFILGLNGTKSLLAVPDTVLDYLGLYETETRAHKQGCSRGFVVIVFETAFQLLLVVAWCGKRASGGGKRDKKPAHLAFYPHPTTPTHRWR